MKIDLKELIPEFGNDLKLDYDLKKKIGLTLGAKLKLFIRLII